MINEREFWPKVLDADVTMMGIPSAELLAGLTDDQVRELFYNPVHLNANGQDYFAPIITPALCKIYAAKINR